MRSRNLSLLVAILGGQIALVASCQNSAPPRQPQAYPPAYGAPPGQAPPYGSPYSPGYGPPPAGAYGPPGNAYPPQPQGAYPPPQSQYGPPQAPYGTPYQQQPPPRPAPYPTAAPAPAPQPPPPAAALPPAALGSFDMNGSITADYTKKEPVSVLAELVNALASADKAKVKGIPLQVVEDPKDVNAFATCDKSGGAFVGITAPILLIMARTSETRAFDETFGSNKYNELANGFASEVRAQKAVTGPGPGFLPLPQALDPRKLARQSLLYDEQLAFVLGHELAHHYRGHTGCGRAANANTITAQDVGRALSSTVPLFNQPNEIQADIEGTYNLLDTGARRQGGKWTEEGAIMMLDFFGRLETLGVETLLLGFLATHPAPQLRLPIVQNTAQQWRSNGGKAPASPFRL